MKKGFKLLALLMVSVFVMGLAACETTQKKDEAVEVESTDAQTEDEMARQEQMELERMRAEEEERRWLEEQERMRGEQDETAAVEVDAYDADTVLQMIHFDFDQYDIKDEYRDVLANNAEWINSHPDTQIQIEGHCDARGTDEYNLALGERRAMAVKNYLVSLGVDEARLYTISYGEEMPLDMGSGEGAWAKNRRSQFRVTSR